MKTERFFTLLLWVSLGSVQLSLAGNPVTPGVHTVERMEKVIRLTDEQKAHIRQETDAYVAKARAIVVTEDSDEWLREKQQVKEAYETALSAILTPEQLEILREKLAERRKEVEEKYLTD